MFRGWIRRSIGVAGTWLVVAQLALSGCGGDGVSILPATAPGTTIAAATGAPATAPDHGATAVDGRVKSSDVRTIPAPKAAVLEESTELVDPDHSKKIKAGLFEIEIPAGAVAEPVQITVRDVSGPTGRIECELLPHGLQFLLPVTLTVEIPEGYDPLHFVMFYVQAPGTLEEAWFPLATRLSGNGQSIEATLTHFSSYAPGSLDGKAGWSPIRRGQKIDQGGR